MYSKRIIAATLFMLFQVGLYSQNWEKISITLQNDLSVNKRNNTWYNLVIVGTKKADLDSLKQDFYNRNLPNSQRAKIVINELQEAAKSQQAILESIQAQPFEVTQQLWVANLMLVKAPKKTIFKLAESPLVERIELEEENLASWHKPVAASSARTQRVNQVEEGIEAIETRFLWNLGYTGKGTKVLNFDTGIWPEHPSFRNNWMGKRAPIDQAWFGFDKKRPGDKTSHGTHTNSTCMGLDPSTNDTMGIAYNAYFLATDPIVDNTADIKSYAEMALGYQWAMNPDGDVSTTDDMPDVINNSWGRAHQSRFDTIVCDGFFGDVLDAVELAGIISIQSAGNEGPGPGTVGSPANRNSTLVNNFSVGAVDGNNPAFPIASFSSRGPSQCGDTGSLYIKPEVVAPGVNVLGAVRNPDLSYGYDFYSGTSMAGPHAAGLSLLLREAFPQASAEEVKMAMYLTAVDLGVTGEDNTYGNGMINAEAAYNYLAQSYTPATPATNNFDLSIEWCNLDEIDFTCDQSFEMKLVVKANPNFTNWGAVQIEYGFLNQPSLFYNFSSAPTSDTITVGTISTNQTGFLETFAQLTYTGSNQEWELANNNWYSRFNIAGTYPLPYSEQFENMNLYRSEWYVEDFENDEAFDTASSTGLTNSNYSARIRLPRYDARDGSRDGLVTPAFEAPTQGTFEMYFDVAYSSAFAGFNDSLLVKVSTDCGKNWVPTDYKKGPNELKTDPDNNGFDWVPQTSNQWRRDTVDLSAFVGANSVLIKFESYNQKGGSIYIDNVNVYGESGPLLVDEKNFSNDVRLFPNPATENVFVSVKQLKPHEKIEIEIVDLRGALISKITTENNQSFPVTELPIGIYLITLKTNGFQQVKRLIKQ